MKNLYSRLIILLIIFLSVAFSSSATTYFVSSTGNDSKSGTSLSNAWTSINKVNSKTFLPGDIILFEGGKTFTGNLQFNQYDAGNAANPVKIASYGNGRAIINSNNGYGFFAFNTAGFKIANLIFKGSGRTTNEDSGIALFSDLENKLLNNVIIDSVEVYGYQVAGIIFGTNKQNSGYANVRITNSSVHDNGNVGISSYSDGTITHKNVYIGKTKVYNNSGIANYTQSHTGSGIMISGIDGAVIEYCEAYNNGWLNAWDVGGPVGIWGYICNNLVIQYNESHHNKTGTTKDGGGFDLDGGVTNSVMQYNYSHDNDGAGYLLAQYSGAPAMKNLTIRYNISENDGRKNSNAGILLWATNSSGGIQDADIYNNTVYLSPASSGSPAAIFVSTGYITNAKVRNNIIQTTGGLQLVRSMTNSGVRFENNAYWSSGSNLNIYWTGTTYNNLDNWRAGTGQEKLNNEPAGFYVDPELINPGKGVIIGNQELLTNLTGYKLKPTSSLIDKGLNMAKEFGLEVGNTDFWKNKIDQRESFSIGAHQYAPDPETKIAQTITFSPIPDKVFGANSFALEATASSGLTVGYSVVSGPATLNNHILTITGTGIITIEASQTGDENYLEAQAIRKSFRVSKASQSITFPAPVPVVYSSVPFVLEATASSELPVSFKIISGPASLTNNVLTCTGSGTITIEALQGGNELYSAAPAVRQNLEVAGLNQAISFAALTEKVAGEEFALLATASSGLAVSFSIVSGPAILEDNILKTTGAGTVLVEATQIGNPIYSAASAVRQDFTVIKASQQIIFAALPDKVFSNAPLYLSASATSGLPVSFEVTSGPAEISGHELTLTGTGLVTIAASQSGSDVFRAAPTVTRSFRVSHLVLSQTINFPAIVTKIYGEEFSLPATATSNLPVFFRILSGPATIINNELKTTGTGLVTVEASQTGNTTYSPAPAITQSFWVMPAEQTISFPALIDKYFGEAPIALDAVATSNLPVTYMVLAGAATISGNMLTFTGAGEVVLRATQAGNNNYLPATTIIQRFFVNKATQAISFPALADKTLGDAAFALTATASSGLPISYALISGPATLSGNMLSINGEGTVVVRAAQSGNNNYEAAAAVEKTFRVSKTPKQVQIIQFTAIPNKTYQATSFTINATASSGLPVNFNILSGPATLSGNNITLTGAGTVVVEAVQPGNDTYGAALAVTRSFTVNKASQTIAFAALPNKNYSQAPIGINATASSNLRVSLTVVAGPAIMKDNVITLTGVDIVTVRATQTGNERYLAAPAVEQSFSVGKAPQTLHFTTLTNKTYGEAPFTLVGSATSGLEVSFRITSGPATLINNILSLTAAGTVTVEASQTGNALYAVAPVVTQTFTINKASQVISFPEIENKQVGAAPFALTATSTNATVPVVFTSSNPQIVAVANTNGKWIATIHGAGKVNITARQVGNDKFLTASEVIRPIVVQEAATVVSETVVETEDKLKIIAVSASINTGMDYTAWLNDDLTDLIEKNWNVSNMKWADVTLKLEQKSRITKIKLFDYEGVFTDMPAEVFAVNKGQNTLMGKFKGENYQEWVELHLPEPLIADAIMIRKYGNNIPQKINVYGKKISAADSSSLADTGKQAETTHITWNVYPNPTPGKIQVELDPKLAGEITIDILDATGHTLEHIVVQNQIANPNFTIALDRYKNGLYFLQLNAKNIREVKKIYKHQ